MRTRSPSHSRIRRGAAIVEVAVLLTPFFLFLFGIFEYSRYIMVLHTATNAARDGARLASVKVTDSTVTGTTVTSSPYSSGAPAYNVATITNHVLARMGGINSQITGFTVRVFPCNTTTLYDDPPTFTPKPGSTAWNNAGFGERIAVRITGTYHPIVPSFLMLQTNIPIDITVTMGSEG
ncbi:MAG: pilus assembly protein [Bacteroidales bacterium]|nr:pilus assembly protein [Bacteroidales bacterium]